MRGASRFAVIITTIFEGEAFSVRFNAAYIGLHCEPPPPGHYRYIRRLIRDAAPPG
jgi:hypothetical protein